MDYKDTLNQLTDLPLTFQRFGLIFAGLIESISGALARSTRALDQLPSQVNLQTARWGWLDVIGKLYRIPRNPTENDNAYRQRLFAMLTATRGTPESIVNFLEGTLGIETTVVENFNTVSFQINFNQFVTPELLQQVAETIVWVRPAGVPFLPFFQTTGGLYLHTLNYFGNRRVTGGYLGSPNSSVNINIPAYTNNPKPILPTVYLTDPYITGNISFSF